jgi:tRNA pseudouridine55 synthase
VAAARPPDGVLLLDKPPGVTSTRALAMARRALEAARAGHTGTLDPFATGLLPLVFGEATKFSRFLIDSTKAYVATLQLGEETESGDTETPSRRVSEDIPFSEQIEAVLPNFKGDISQIPPMHSAVHFGGRRLYEYAREGREVAREPRQVHVFELEIVSITGPQLVLAVTCSKGTYIRVLASDIGRALGCGAYLSALRRTAVGGFSIESAATPEELAALGTEGARSRLLPVDALVAGLSRADVDDEAAIRFGHGQPIEGANFAAGTPVAVFAGGRRFLGVGLPDGERIAPMRLMSEPPKSPDFA